jgi:hypothetical protein
VTESGSITKRRAALGLGLQEGEGAADIGERVADPQAPAVEVDVLPAEAKQLPLA